MFGTSDPLRAAAEAYNPTPPKGTPYSVPVPGSKVEGRSAVYRHFDYVDKPLLETLVPSLRTAHDGFEHAATLYPKQRCLGHRPYDTTKKTWGPYVWEDYQTIQTRRKNLGAGLVHLHKQVGVTKEIYGIGLWCQNRPEWQITDLAAMSQRLYTVSIYDTLGPETTEYIINHSELVCVAASLNHVTALLKLKPRLPTLKLIMVLDPIASGELPGESKADILTSLAAEVGVSIHYIKDVEALGESHPLPMKAPTPEDVVTINYTSGTTGNPKGVVLPHRAAWAAACVSMMFFPTNTSTILCSFLPLAHIFQRLGENSALAAGASIGYFHGNVAELVDDLKLLRPTQFSGVPRLYNRFGGAIKAATTEQAGFKGALSRHIISTKLAAINDKHNPTSKHALYDRIWSKKVAAGIGLDRCENMVSGSAPIDPTLHQFLRVCFGNSFVQGWGMTESYALGLIQDTKNDYSTGTCGGVVPAVEACLVDVPDMEYFSTDKPFPRGELCVRGNNIFLEYLGNPEETAKTLDADGWLHTGDIATMDAQGRFKIIDRKKNVLKLAQGEYISPERIENVYLANCPWLATAYVHGDSQQASLVGLFGVAIDMFPAFASKVLGEKIEVGDVESLKRAIMDKRVEEAVLKELTRVGKKKKFNSWEHVKALRLFVDPFTLENELLTPTLKLKRPQTVKKYRKELDDCYEEVLALEASGKTTKAKL